MFKKSLLLAAATGLVLSTGAFAQGTAPGTNNDAKNNNPSFNSKNQPAQATQNTKPMKSTTGAASGSSSDPRDVNKPAMAKDKTHLEDAKQQK